MKKYVVRVSELRKLINKQLSETYQTTKEDHTAHSKESGYTDEIEEAAAGTLDPRQKPQSAQSSATLHTRDKSQMQGVGPRPTMATAFEPIGKKKEGVSQSKRLKVGYQGETPADYDVSESLDDLQEVAPPSEKAEKFIHKNKEDFKKRYGARWKEVLYATAYKMFGNGK